MGKNDGYILNYRSTSKQAASEEQLLMADMTYSAD